MIAEDGEGDGVFHSSPKIKALSRSALWSCPVTRAEMSIPPVPRYTCESIRSTCWLFWWLNSTIHIQEEKAFFFTLNTRISLPTWGLERSESCQSRPTGPRDREAFGRLQEHGAFASPRRLLLAPAFLMWGFSCPWLHVWTDRCGQTPAIFWRAGGLKTI